MTSRLLLPVDMREWLPEDDLVFIVLNAVAVSYLRSAGAAHKDASKQFSYYLLSAAYGTGRIYGTYTIMNEATASRIQIPGLPHSIFTEVTLHHGADAS